jgi:exopolysaccharide biosynthesis protein
VASFVGLRVGQQAVFRKEVFLLYGAEPLPLEFGDDIVGGVPQLIRNGKIDITWQEEKTTKAFVETRHPRTAVAKLKDGKFLMITVDGRSESSGGIGLPDLAALLLELGATDAMNLDGGGSTTMYLDGKVVNHPSDKEGERKVSDAILVTLRRPRQRHDR